MYAVCERCNESDKRFALLLPVAVTSTVHHRCSSSSHLILRDKNRAIETLFSSFIMVYFESYTHTPPEDTPAVDSALIAPLALLCCFTCTTAYLSCQLLIQIRMSLDLICRIALRFQSVYLSDQSWD